VRQSYKRTQRATLPDPRVISCPTSADDPVQLGAVVMLDNEDRVIAFRSKEHRGRVIRFSRGRWQRFIQKSFERPIGVVAGMTMDGTAIVQTSGLVNMTVTAQA
jgi:hypothetical protein